jgi:parvulin-like peptidyl-prolyl isomerase
MTVFTRILVSLAGLAVLAGGAVAQVPAQKPAAVVNDEPISTAELQAFLKASQPPSPTTVSEAVKKEMQQTAIQLLVDDVLMRQYLRKNAPPASQQEIDKEFGELKVALAKDQKMSLEEFLRSSGQNEQQLKADIAARIQWKNFISPRLTDKAVKDYYDANKVFFDKVMVRASHILLKVAPNATQQDKQLLYNRLTTIRQEILAAKVQFADAAKKYSDCESKMNGGDVGLFPSKFAVAEAFSRAAFSMKKNELSDVVQTEFGYHIILVTDRTAGEPSNFEKIKADVKDICAQEYYQQIIAEQRRVAKIVVNP